MTYSESANQLTGLVTIYLAPYGSAMPNTIYEPAPPTWRKLGVTKKSLVVSQPGLLIYHYEHSRTGPSKAVRGMTDVLIDFLLEELSVEEYARILSSIESTDKVNGIITLPLKREYFPFEYSLVARGTIFSRYGTFPGSYIIPRGVFDGEPRVLIADDGTQNINVTFRALEDYDQEDEALGLGWLVLKVS